MENTPKVKLEIEPEGVQMTYTTWQNLQQQRGTPLFSTIEKLIRDTVAKGQHFKVYDDTEPYSYSQCNNVDQLNELFETDGQQSNPKQSEAT